MQFQFSAGSSDAAWYLGWNHFVPSPLGLIGFLPDWAPVPTQLAISPTQTLPEPPVPALWQRAPRWSSQTCHFGRLWSRDDCWHIRRRQWSCLWAAGFVRSPRSLGGCVAVWHGRPSHGWHICPWTFGLRASNKRQRDIGYQRTVSKEIGLTFPASTKSFAPSAWASSHRLAIHNWQPTTSCKQSGPSGPPTNNSDQFLETNIE